MATDKKLLTSTTSPDVWLSGSEVRFRKLPAGLRKRVIKALDQVATIRLQIAEDSKVGAMPPVQCVLEMWGNPATSSWFHGLAGMLAIDGKSLPVAQLAAQLFLCGDESKIRGLLVHEFCHCFQFNERAFHAWKAGQSHADERSLDPFNAEDDRKAMVNPEDWFGAGDCAAMFYHSENPTDFSNAKIMSQIGSWIPLSHPPMNDGEEVEHAIYIGRDAIWTHTEKLWLEQHPEGKQ